MLSVEVLELEISERQLIEKVGDPDKCQGPVFAHRTGPSGPKDDKSPKNISGGTKQWGARRRGDFNVVGNKRTGHVRGTVTRGRDGRSTAALAVRDGW